MSWSIYGNTYESDADLTNMIHTCRAKMNKDIFLRYVRTWVIFYDDPGIINLTMKIYYDENESKGDLLYSSSTTHTKAEMITLDNGAKDLYFQFADVELDGDNYYHFVLTGTSSGLSSSSYIAWKTSFPRPVYQDGFTQSSRNLPQYPYSLVIIGAEY